MEGANRFQKEYVYFSKPLKIAVSYKFEMKFASESKTKLKTNQTKNHHNKNLPLQEIRNVWLYFPVAIPYFQLKLLYFSANCLKFSCAFFLYGFIYSSVCSLAKFSYTCGVSRSTWNVTGK